MSREVPNPFRLDGVAIVTGASSGIGAHFTSLLARSGMTVVAAARRTDRLDDLAAADGRIVPAACDVTSSEDLARIVELATGQGRLSVVVNNAGITDATTRADDQERADFRRVASVNLDAVFDLSIRAARVMIGHGAGGSIVNISSIHGIVAAAPNHQAAYVASKTGVIGLTRELAGQWAGEGIRVNAIAPGYFPSELTEEMLAAEDGGLRWIRRNTFARRPGRLEELDGALLLLASQAGSYITGQCIAVDGGWTAR